MKEIGTELFQIKNHKTALTDIAVNLALSKAASCGDNVSVHSGAGDRGRPCQFTQGLGTGAGCVSSLRGWGTGAGRVSSLRGWGLRRALTGGGGKFMNGFTISVWGIARRSVATSCAGRDKV